MLSDAGEAWGGAYRATQKRRLAKARAFLLKHIHKADGAGKICEVGCANGDFTELFIKELKDWSVTGIDLVEAAVGRCRERFKGNGRLEFKTDSLPALREPDGEYDAVVCMDVLYYLEDKMQDGINELGRILKRDGVAVLMIPTTDEDKEGKNFIKQAGSAFDIIDVEYVYSRLYSRYFEPVIWQLYWNFYQNDHLGRPGRLIGKMSRKIYMSKRLEDAVYRISQKRGVKGISHILVAAKRKG